MNIIKLNHFESINPNQVRLLLTIGLITNPQFSDERVFEIVKLHWKYLIGLDLKSELKDAKISKHIVPHYPIVYKFIITEIVDFDTFSNLLIFIKEDIPLLPIPITTSEY